MDEEAHAGDDEEHEAGEVVQKEAEGDAGKPLRLEAGPAREEKPRPQEEGGEDEPRGQDPGEGLSHPFAEEAEEGEAQQGQENRPEKRHAYPRSSERSSTAVLSRWRKMATMRPRPTATSAAATAMTMRAATWPSSP